MSTGVNIARRLWDQREELREAYEAEHGSDQDGWLSPSPNRATAGAAEVWHWAESQNRPTFETTRRLPARMADALVRNAAWCRPGYGPAM
jgi:hypothetical protein